MVTIFSVQFTGTSLVRFLKFCMYLSVCISSVALISGVLGLVAEIYVYAVLANTLMVFYPMMLYFMLKQRYWTRKLLALQAGVSCLYVILLIITNSITINHFVIAYRYCFGDLNSDCEEASDNQDFDLICDGDESGDGTKVYCPDKSLLELRFACVSANYIACALLFAYFLASLAVRRYLPTTPYEQHTNDTPEDSQSTLPIYTLYVKKPPQPQVIEVSNKA